MGWFDEQIRLRKKHDNDVFAQSFSNIANTIDNSYKKEKQENELNYSAINEILSYYDCKAEEIDISITDLDEQIEYLTRPHGIMYRNVTLKGKWYKDAIGAYLGTLKKDNKPIALLPSLFGYKYKDDETNKYVSINSKTNSLINEEAICFYKPFPTKKLKPIDLIKYALLTRNIYDIISFVVFITISSLLGLLMPYISYILYSKVIEEKSISLLLSTITFYICVNISSSLFNTFKTMVNEKINKKMNISVQAATMMRILSLPANFFRKYSSGELQQRSSYVSNLCSTLINTVFDTSITSLFSLIYIGSIFAYAPTLVVPALIIILINITVSIVSTLVQTKLSKETMETSSKESGLSYSLLSGIQKIKLAGSEKRAFAKWADLYAKQSNLTYNPPKFIKYNTVITMTISYIGSLVMYYFALKANLSVADYNAFNTAYGLVSGTFSSMASIALTIAQIKPVLQMAKPILDEVPEMSQGKKVITRLNGGIELNDISFRYSDNMPYVLENLSLKIKPGEYVAIVGKTGCGKSTLIRLLLGFEKPNKGAIYYDGKDINSIDLKSLRRKIGIVLQDGKLFQGDIYSNITISAPQLTLQDAWEAAEMAGIAEDIRRMPMGMNTFVTEGSGGISGGQRQRIMIARAIAPKPKILIFDEATSALDNITQRKVSESLDSLKCTRLVIAHRLSTIKNCDRILCIDGGRIIEEGTYEQLVKQKGFFYELIEKQRIDKRD